MSTTSLAAMLLGRSVRLRKPPPGVEAQEGVIANVYLDGEGIHSVVLAGGCLVDVPPGTSSSCSTSLTGDAPLRTCPVAGSEGPLCASGGRLADSITKASWMGSRPGPGGSCRPDPSGITLPG